MIQSDVWVVLHDLSVKTGLQSTNGGGTDTLDLPGGSVITCHLAKFINQRIPPPRRNYPDVIMLAPLIPPIAEHIIENFDCVQDIYGQNHATYRPLLIEPGQQVYPIVHNNEMGYVSFHHGVLGIGANINRSAYVEVEQDINPIQRNRKTVNRSIEFDEWCVDWDEPTPVPASHFERVMELD